MTDITIPEEAVNAAAQDMADAAVFHLGRDLGTVHRNEIALAALEAAAPLILAAELERLVDETDWAWAVGSSLKARAAELRGVGSHEAPTGGAE